MEFVDIKDLPLHLSREAWLASFVSIMRPRLSALGFILPDDVRVSIGWPSKGGTSRSRRRLYDLWPAETSRDHATELFISPLLHEPIDILTTTVAGLGVACVGVNDKEGFKRYMKTIGLSGKPAEPVCGDELRFFLEKKLEELGEFPGAAIDPEALLKDAVEKKPGSRMLKVECKAPECGYTLRTTKQWVLRGLPTCCCGSEMVGPLIDADGDVVEETK